MDLGWTRGPSGGRSRGRLDARLLHHSPSPHVCARPPSRADSPVGHHAGAAVARGGPAPQGRSVDVYRTSGDARNTPAAGAALRGIRRLQAPPCCVGGHARFPRSSAHTAGLWSRMAPRAPARACAEPSCATSLPGNALPTGLRRGCVALGASRLQKKLHCICMDPPKMNPISTPDQAKPTPNRTRIDQNSIPDRPLINPRSTPGRPHLDARRTLDRHHTGP